MFHLKNEQRFNGKFRKNSIYFTIYTHTTYTHPRQTKNLNMQPEIIKVLEK